MALSNTKDFIAKYNQTRSDGRTTNTANTSTSSESPSPVASAVKNVRTTTTPTATQTASSTASTNSANVLDIFKQRASNTGGSATGVNNSASTSYLAQLMGKYSNANTAATAAANTTTEEAAPKATMNSPTTLLNNTGTSTSTATGTTSTYTPTGMYDPANLEAYNRQRESDLRSLYDTAQQSTLAGLKTAYGQNLSTARAAREQIIPQYQSSANALSAEYERQRRNNNMQANLNGLNTGAGSQMALAQSANYQASQAGLAQQQNQALDEANRAIADLKMNYQNAIAEATANNNYQKAAALLDEYENAYNRQMAINDANYTRAWNEDERNYSRNLEEASAKAQYGDFSGYANLYGSDIAKAMELTWALQNPDIAYAAGKLSAEDYQTLTGNSPNNASSSSTISALLKRVSSFSGGGYSSYGTGTGTGTGSGTETETNPTNLSYSSPFSTNYITDSDGTSLASGKYANLSPLAQATSRVMASTSSSDGGTSYGNIGNNKLTVGG